MRISPNLHPVTHAYLTSKGYATPGTTTSVDLPEFGPFLENLFVDSEDNFQYLLKPVLLDLFSVFYPHDDCVVTLNNFISERYPTPNSESRSCSLG